MLKLIVTLLTLSCCTYIAHSLKCYTCYNTSSYSSCNDPFNKTNIAILDCGSTYRNYEKFMCYKFANNTSNALKSPTAVARGCLPYSGTFSKKEACGNSNSTACYFCSDDKCNSAPVNEVVGIFSLFVYAVLYFTK